MHKDYIELDYKDHLRTLKIANGLELNFAELAKIGAEGIVKQFPDEVGAFHLALAVIRQLDASGTVFAHMGPRIPEFDQQ